jgi:hypothetical protein
LAAEVILVNNRSARFLGGALALAGSGLAVGLGFVFTGWLLVNPSGPGLGEWLAFLGASAFLAALGALPGLAVGVVLARINRPKDGDAAPDRGKGEAGP